jgi:hypothetical protein
LKQQLERAGSGSQNGGDDARTSSYSSGSFGNISAKNRQRHYKQLANRYRCANRLQTSAFIVSRAVLGAPGGLVNCCGHLCGSMSALV